MKLFNEFKEKLYYKIATNDTFNDGINIGGVAGSLTAVFVLAMFSLLWEQTTQVLFTTLICWIILDLITFSYKVCKVKPHE